MIELNCIHITGRLVKDPHELEYTAGGTACCRFRIASDSGYGERKKTTFISVTAWGKTAEFAAKWLTKGSAVYVQGRIEGNEWEAKDGSGKKSEIRIQADRVQFGESKSEAEQRGGGDATRQDESAPESEPATATATHHADDDLPF
jgi:single-strand DNA-binding protein